MGFTACTTRLVMIHHLVIQISSTLTECCGRLTIKVNGWYNMIVYKCFFKWIDNEIAEVFVLWREVPDFFAHADATLLENCQQVNVLTPTFNKI